MLKRQLLILAAIGLFAIGTASVYAGDCSTDCDTTLRQGRVFEAWNSQVVYGADGALLSRVWIPLLIDNGGPLLEDAVVRIVNHRILGVDGMYGSSAIIQGLVSFGTVDFNFAGGDPLGSNNIFIYESGASDTPGRLLSDGKMIWRANYAGLAQNGFEWTTLTPNQVTPIPEPDSGTNILTGSGFTGASSGNVYLGTPEAIAGGAGLYVADTIFAPDGLNQTGLNIWNYNLSTPTSGNSPTYFYSQAGAENFANTHGVPCDTGDGRQSQPVMAKIGNDYYVAFGINDTTVGGSGRPAMLCVDKFSDGTDNYVGAIAIIAPTGYRFVDHQANGGGANQYENKHFEMNKFGQIALMAEKITTNPYDPHDAPTYQALLYNPIMTDGQITNYNAPILIADAGPADQKPEDELAGPFYYDPDPNSTTDLIVWYNSISGLGINDRGNVAFTATYDTGVPFDPQDPESPTIWNDAAYFYHGATGTLHQVLREEDVVTYNNHGNPLAVKLGLIARDDSDAFMGSSLAKDADVLAVNFRSYNGDVNPELGGSRGVAVVAVGHSGDTDFDGDVDLSDLAALLGVYGAQFGTSANYDSQIDFNLDGVIGLSDLAELLGHYGQ
jgi:hypothetical protein